MPSYTKAGEVAINGAVVPQKNTRVRYPPICGHLGSVAVHREAAIPLRGTAAPMSDISVLGERQGVFDIDAEIAHRVLNLGMPKQDLHGSQVASRLINHRRLSTAQ